VTPNIKIEKDFKRPWGGFIKFVDNKPCTVKIHYLKKGGSFSLQSHKSREEFWFLISGEIKVFVGKSQKNLRGRVLKESQCVFLPKKSLHRAEGIKSSVILEICFGKFKENDEIRYWDKYGRISPK